MVTNIEGLVSFANELANESENIIKQYFRTTLTIDAKNDDTPVTIADKNTELKIRELIQQNYPNHGILGEEFEGKNIDDILNSTIDDAVAFFIKHQQIKIANKLKPLQDVGLGYVQLGQSSSTLSGGEAQRRKLASL